MSIEYISNYYEFVDYDLKLEASFIAIIGNLKHLEQADDTPWYLRASSLPPQDKGGNYFSHYKDDKCLLSTWWSYSNVS